MEGQLKKRLSRFINYKWTEVGIAVLILISVVLVFIEATMDRAAPRFSQIETANDILTILFIIELGIRFYIERRKSRFFKSYWLDIIAVLPSFRILRALRIFRLFRVGMIFARHFSPTDGTATLVKREYIVVAGIVIISVLMGAVAMRFAEGKINDQFEHIEQTLWFATMTLVAGEPIGGEPTTNVGRAISLILMMGGLTVFAIFTGTVSAFMTESITNFRIRSMQLEDLRKHLVICGWNRSAIPIIAEMVAEDRDAQVVIVSDRTDLIHDPQFDRYASNVHHLEGDFTRLDVLKDAGIERAAFAIVLSDNASDRPAQDQDARAVLAAMLIEKMNANIFTTVQLHNRDNQTSLKSAGVEEIIVTDEYVGNVMATVVRSHGIVSVLDELLTAQHGHQFYKTTPPKAILHMKVTEAMNWLKAEHDATLIAIQRSADGEIVVNPPSDYEITSGDGLFVTANKPISQ